MIVGASIAASLLAAARALRRAGVNPHPVGDTAQRFDGPVRRLAMVLRPEREMPARLEVVRAWPADSDVLLAGWPTTRAR
jgi:hypothetical protein